MYSVIWGLVLNLTEGNGTYMLFHAPDGDTHGKCRRDARKAHARNRVNRALFLASHLFLH
jgi:hypothetical protein